MAKIIGTADNWNFWLIGNEVYRATVNSILDIHNLPSDKRWECSLAQWQNFRNSVFSWVREVA